MGQKADKGTPDDHPVEDLHKSKGCFGWSKDPKNNENCNKCGKSCLKALYVVLGIVITFLSIALIAVSITAAAATKIFANDNSGRLVSMIILALTAAVVICLVITGSIALFKKNKKPLLVANAVLFIVAIIQALIAGIAVKVTQEDEVNLTRSLIESFRLAKDENPRQVKLWSVTQHDLTCCGVFSPEDYRSPGVAPYLAPDVPVSCCPAYDPDRSDLVQESARRVCKYKKNYFQAGCKGTVLEVFKHTSGVAFAITVVLIVLEVVAFVLGTSINYEKKKENMSSLEEGPSQKCEVKTSEKFKQGK